MEHHHKHTNAHHREESLHGKKLLWVTLINLSITIVQIVGGIVSNSLSLLSDAIHNLGDSSAVFIAFVAGKIGVKKPDAHNTFGYKRAEILAASFNSMVLIAICILLVVEAVQRFINPEPVHGKLMLMVASFGLLANLLSVLILNKDKDHNLNVKAAYLHLLGDTLSSVAVIAGGLAIWKFGMMWLDPLVTVAVAVYITIHTWSVLKETVNILMQSTPENIDLADIKQAVEKVNGVDNIHHVHIWKLSDSETHFEAHLNLDSSVEASKITEIQRDTEKLLCENFKINHITLQMCYNCCNGDDSLIMRVKS